MKTIKILAIIELLLVLLEVLLIYSIGIIADKPFISLPNIMPPVLASVFITSIIIFIIGSIIFTLFIIIIVLFILQITNKRKEDNKNLQKQ